MEDFSIYLPRDKHDFERVNQLRNLDDSILIAIIPNLVEWLQDINWPPSEVSCETFEETIPHIKFEPWNLFCVTYSQNPYFIHMYVNAVFIQLTFFTSINDTNVPPFYCAAAFPAPSHSSYFTIENTFKPAKYFSAVFFFTV